MSILPLVTITLGVFLLYRLRFFFIASPKRTISLVREALSLPTARRNLSLSLAGTLGVGNIVGVAVGISIGGAGSVFWLLVSSLFSIIIKYAESSLSAELSAEWGILGVFCRLFSRFGKILGAIYSVFCIFLSFVLGSAIQSNAIVGCALELGIMPVISLFLVTAIVILVLIVGRDKIKGISTALVPLASIIYIILCLFAIFSNFRELPRVILGIFKGAFSLDSASGGILGFITSTAIKEGFSRGLMSNEAGAGTSSLANSEGMASPAHAGLLGALEVFFDTVIICTLSALAILTACGDKPSLGGIDAVIGSLGGLLFGAGRHLLLFSVFLFALSSIICWYYYGVKCVRFLGFKVDIPYSALFLLTLYLPLFMNESVLISISDFLLLVLTFLTSLALIKGSDRIRTLSELSGLIPPPRH